MSESSKGIASLGCGGCFMLAFWTVALLAGLSLLFSGCEGGAS